MKQQLSALILSAACILTACGSEQSDNGNSSVSTTPPQTTPSADVSDSATTAPTETTPEVTTTVTEPEPELTVTTTTVTEPEPELTITTTVTEPEPEIPEVKAAPAIELSGNADDTFTAESDCYAEGEDFVLYFQKGVTVRGDMLETTEMIMQKLCDATGFNFEKNSDELERRYGIQKYDYAFGDYYETGVFSEVNKNGDKIDILIVDLTNGGVEWADTGFAVIDYEDYADEEGYQTLYHELAHVIHSRNGVLLGQTLTEGYASYITDKIVRTTNIPDWNTEMYYYPDDEMNAELDALISQGEEGFNHQYLSSRNLPYYYGMRFIVFLTDTYGEGIFADILNEATRQDFDSSYNPSDEENSQRADREQMIAIIKSQTSDDVFEQFKEWYFSNWSIKAEEYRSYMASIGYGW